QLVEEALHAPHRLDVEGCPAVHARRTGTLVPPHPSPPDQEEGGIGNEIEKVVKPAMRILAGPTVQLGLDTLYPSLGLIQHVLQPVGVHRRRPPGIPASSPQPCWPPSPCARLSRARTTTGPPPHPHPSVGNGPAPTPWTGGPGAGRTRMVPTFTMFRS